jgi:hypothetical protein
LAKSAAIDYQAVANARRAAVRASCIPAMLPRIVTERLETG